MSVVKVGSFEVEITHPDKVLFPEDNLTKAEFIDYHRRIAGVMIPHITGRPVSMQRFTGGINNKGFFQQVIPESAPAWITRVKVKKAGGSITHLICDNPASLVYMANQDCITPHVWLSRMDQPEKPDQMIFDLDPSEDNFKQVREGAKYLKRLLDIIGLKAFLKTTGSKGLHVVVPILRDQSFDGVRNFAQRVAFILIQSQPQKFTAEQRKEKRGDRLFIDTLRNAYAHTAVAPYAVRAIPNAPVAAPLFWEELEDDDLTARRFNIHNILKRIKKLGDPWKDLELTVQSLEHFRPGLDSIRRFV
jgi:bifunctional non-homologous end joining protein LigD